MLVSLRFLLVVLVLIGANRALAAETTRRIERMLPNDTLAFVSIKNVPQLIERWNRLGFRSPFANPALQAVIKRVEEHFPKQLLDTNPKWAELLPCATGEACIAVVPSEAGTPAVVLAMDVQGQAEKAYKFFYNLLGLPKLDEEQIIVAALRGLWLDNDVLFFTTEPGLIRKMLAVRKGKGGLFDSVLYHNVMDQCQAIAQDVEPEVRFFAKPIEYVAFHTGVGKHEKQMTAGQFLLQVRANGFDAIRGVGGACWFDRDRHSLLYHVGIYAPDQTTTAMRMLLLPNRDRHELPLWIPKDVAGCTSFFWDMPQAFEAFAKLFGSVVGDRFGTDEDIFEAILDSFRDDPNGPRVDIRGDCIQRLAERVLVVSNSDQSPGSVWDRTVYAFELKDEAPVARLIHKYVQELKPDSEVIEEKISGHVLYAVRIQEEQDKGSDPVPETLQFNFGDVPALPPPTKKQANDTDDDSRGTPGDYQDPNRTIFLSVAHGYLLWGNNGKLIKRLLVGGEALAEDNQYKSVQRELDRLADGPTSFRSFSRYGDDFRLLGRCMDTGNFFTPFFLEAGTLDLKTLAKKQQLAKEQRSVKKQQPTHNIPQAIRSPGSAGWFAKSLPNGWRIVGFVLKPAFVESEVKP